MNNEQYCGTKPILESEPIDIPNAMKCRENHGLGAVIPREDMTFGVFRRKLGYKLRIKSLEKQKREIEKRDREELEKVSREREKAILEEYNRNDAEPI